MLRTLSNQTGDEILHLKSILSQRRRNGQSTESISDILCAFVGWIYYCKGKKNDFLNKCLARKPANPIQIDIGCGVRKKTGFIGIDFMKYPDVDLVVDLTKTGLPFEDNTVDEAWSNHFLEHLAIEDVCKVMEEIHRVCKPWAYVEIRVPHFSGLTNFYEFHKTSFRYNSFSEFVLAGWGMFNSQSVFYLESTKINIVNRQSPKLRPHTKWFLWNYPIEWVVNKMPLFYELTGFRSLFPAWELIFKFRVVK